MKKISLLCVLALALCAVASANIIPTWDSTTGTGIGPFTWNYQAQLSADQNANVGVVPPLNLPMNLVPITTATGAFFTIYDFAGYVTGSCAGPAGWFCTAQNTGFTPSNVNPTDNVNITNITWTHTTGSSLTGQPSGMDLDVVGGISTFFSAKSTISLATQVSYASRGVANAGPNAGTTADNVGFTQAPSPVPEPATMGLIGAGLIGLGLLRRKARKS